MQYGYAFTTVVLTNYEFVGVANNEIDILSTNSKNITSLPQSP
jgi:hypothetical protein